MRAIGYCLPLLALMLLMLMLPLSFRRFTPYLRDADDMFDALMPTLSLSSH